VGVAQGIPGTGRRRDPPRSVKQNVQRIPTNGFAPLSLFLFLFFFL
jgi:hypothetical protein